MSEWLKRKDLHILGTQVCCETIEVREIIGSHHYQFAIQPDLHVTVSGEVFLGSVIRRADSSKIANWESTLSQVDSIASLLLISFRILCQWA